MPISFAVDRDARLLRFRLHGIWTTAEMIAQVNAALDELAGETGYDILSDNRTIENIALPEQIRELATVIRQRGQMFRGGKAAVVVNNDTSFGMIRMLSAHADAAGVDVRPFRTMEEAMRFLRPDQVPGRDR